MAERYSIGGIDLPDNAMVTAGDGVQLERQLTRAVESGEWEMHGDGQPNPVPLVIEFTVTGTSEADAAAQVAAIWAVSRDAPSITRDGKTRPLLGAQAIQTQHAQGDSSTQRVTLTLLAKTPYWGGNYLF